MVKGGNHHLQCLINNVMFEKTKKKKKKKKILQCLIEPGENFQPNRGENLGWDIVA